MNYEQKYKKALEWMQSLYDGLHGATKEEAEHYFPELKESEDKKIKREIVAYINELADLKNEKIPTKWLTWLEKQGEQTHAELSQQEVTKTSDQEPHAHPDIDVRTMAAWQSGYKEAIDKACEWLSAELDKEEERHYIHVHGFDKEHREIFLEDFRKAMKGE